MVTLFFSSCGSDVKPSPRRDMEIKDRQSDMGEDVFVDLDDQKDLGVSADGRTQDMMDMGAQDETLLLEVNADLNNGVSKDIEFTVPEEAKAVFVQVIGRGAQAFTLSSWKNGDKSELVTENWVDTTTGSLCKECPNRVFVSEAVSISMAPNNDKVELKPGVHHIRVWGINAEENPLNTQVLIRVKMRNTTPPENASLLLNLHFSGAYNLTAQSAQSDRTFQSALNIMKDVYKQGKINVKVNYFDIDPSFQIIPDIGTPNSDLLKLFAINKPEADPNGINIFFVKELQSSTPVRGKSGGIPGPLFHGSLMSGVAIALKHKVTDGFVIAHELGHYLGLFHSSERPQTMIHDQLSDTLENDDTNLMFYEVAGSKLSSSQYKVIRLNPWVQ